MPPRLPSREFMLTFQDKFVAGDFRRRSFLRVGSLGLMGGLALPQLATLKALAGSKKSPLRDKSVVFLFMHGGPSQFETFDLKMDAPSSVRSLTGEINTTIPGVTFGSTFHQLAQRVFSIVVACLRHWTIANAHSRVRRCEDSANSKEWRSMHCSTEFRTHSIYRRKTPKLIARYDTASRFSADRINKKWNNHRHYADHGATIGKLVLLARRLCERGCGFVTVTTSFV